MPKYELHVAITGDSYEDLYKNLIEFAQQELESEMKHNNSFISTPRWDVDYDIILHDGDHPCTMKDGTLADF